MKVTVRFRGRELSYASQSGFEVLKHVVDAVADLSKVESPPKMEGKTMMSILAPTAPKKKAPAAPKTQPPKEAGAKPAGGEAPAAREGNPATEKQEGR